MAVEIDYDKRSIVRNVFDPGAWKNLLSNVGEVAGDVATTWEQIERMKGAETEYQPELALADFKFTPNVTLITIGCVLLAIAWMLKK